MCKQAVDSVLGNATYNHATVPQWTSNVCRTAGFALQWASRTRSEQWDALILSVPI
jgi:hypothetical protein